MPPTVKDSWTLRNYALLGVIILVGFLLCFSGWKGRFDPYAVDDVANRANVRALVYEGTLPQTSGLSSLGTYNPPGSAWYYIPSIFFADFRVGERAANLLLYLATAIPLFLIGRRVAGTTTALILVVLYTMSSVGIEFEQTLKYRARPFSYWLMYFLILWFETERARYLVASILTLGVGLLIFYEMAPIAVGIAFASWKFRPRVNLAALAGGSMVVLILWLPYLSLQVDRDFVDITASATRANIGPDKFSVMESFGDQLGTWDSSGNLGPFKPPKEPSERTAAFGPAKRLVVMAFWAVPHAVANFKFAHYAGSIPFLIVVVLILLGWNHYHELPSTQNHRLLTTVSVVFVLLAIVCNELVISAAVGRQLSGSEEWLVRLVQIGLLSAAGAIHLRHELSRFARRLTSKAGFGGKPQPLPKDLWVIIYVTVPTWAAFAIITQSTRHSLGFWVLQWLLIGLILLHLPRHYRMSGRVRLIAALLAMVLIIPNRRLVGDVQSWFEQGFSGQPNDAELAADAIAKQIRTAGIRDPRVGYFLAFNGFELVFGYIDSRYGGIGVPVSQYLQIEHRIELSEQPPEGFSSGDDFRIVQTGPTGGFRYHRFFVPNRGEFRSIGSWGRFEGPRPVNLSIGVSLLATLKLSILIPLYNEETTIEQIVQNVHSVDLEILGLEKEIIVIDDGSTDRSCDIASDLQRQNRIHILLEHGRNRGKGAALRTGIERASGDLVLIQDADLEYNPTDYLLLLEPLVDGRADVVYGSRFLTGRSRRVLFFWHAVANRFLTLVSNMTTNLNLTDIETCYKVFRTEILKQIELEEDRFGFEPEVTAKIGRLARKERIRIYEVGISYDGRTYSEGKKITWKDAVSAFRCILKYGLLRR